MRINWAMLEDALPHVKGRTVDVGCGLQPYVPMLEQAASEVVGMDWTLRPQADHKPQLLADLSKGIPLADGSADTVLASHVLEHLQDPDLFLRECRRVLAPGGSLIVLVPFLWQVHEAPHDHHRFTRYALEAHLTKAGFTGLDIAESTNGWGMVALHASYLGTKPARIHLRMLRAPLLWLLRRLAGPLDAAKATPEYTAGYRVVARRPA
jgi:SAM-dependent methyltransferase